MSQLALFGGPKVRPSPFPRHPVIGDEEKQAVMAVLESGNLSSFIAAPGPFFLGGARVREFEARFAESHGTQYAVAFNSATAALHAAVTAVGVEPGQEVIVPPYTFTSTATCALMHNAIPVFADIEDDYYCIDPAAIEDSMSALTRAVIPVHLFGQPADMDRIMGLADRHGLKVIEDCAQAPDATYRGAKVGTIGDCGIFSFTESKTMTTGEGGMLITNDGEIARVAQMVRNHGEVISGTQTVRTYRADLLGWNYRMPEMEAALGIVQLQRLSELNERRITLADYLTARLAKLDGLEPPPVRPECTHVYYVYPFRFDAEQTGMSRERFAEAMAAEGVSVGVGYVRPLYLSPLYHEHKASAFRFYSGRATYDKGRCPVTERLYEQELLLLAMARAPATVEDMDDVVQAMSKVLAARDELA